MLGKISFLSSLSLSKAEENALRVVLFFMSSKWAWTCSNNSMRVYLKGKTITNIKNYLDKDVIIPYMKFVKKNRNLFSLYEQGKIDDSSLNKDI